MLVTLDVLKLLTFMDCSFSHPSNMPSIDPFCAASVELVPTPPVDRLDMFRSVRPVQFWNMYFMLTTLPVLKPLRFTLRRLV